MMATPDPVERPQHGADDDSGTTVLAAVQEALTDRPPATVSASHHAPAADQPVARGDVRVVKSLPWMEGRRRLAIVRRVDADHDSVDMMLAHPWPELATDTDAVVASDPAGLPHPLVVQCYVRGPVWLRQVRERVGLLTESVLQAIGAAVVDGQANVEGAQTGLPLAGPADPRWRFKEDEVLEWSTLTDDCTSALLEGADPWQLEPELLHPHTYAQASDPATPSRDYLGLEETVHLLATRPVTVELHDLDPQTFDPDHWTECLGRDLGLTAFATVQPTLQNAFSHAGAKVLQEAA